MRRPLTGLLTGLAVSVASLALTSCVLSIVLFDPGRPARVVHAMLDTPQGRGLAADVLAGQLERADPSLSSSRARQVSGRVVNDPRLEGALSRAQDARTPDQAASAVLDSLRRVDPHLARTMIAHLPHDAAGNPRLDVVPAQVSGRAGDVRVALAWFARLAALAAACLAAAALLIGPRRDLVMKRLGRWCLVSSGVQLLFWVVLPRLLDHMSGRWPAVLAAGIRASSFGLFWLFAGLLTAGFTLLAAGVAGRFLVPVSGNPHWRPASARR